MKHPTLMALAVALVLVASPAVLVAHAATQSQSSKCYDPTDSFYDSSGNLKTFTPDYWTDQTPLTCDMFLGNQTITVFNPADNRVAGSPNGLADGTFDATIQHANQGTIYVLIGHAQNDDFDVHFYDASDKLVGQGTSSGDELGFVPHGTSYAIVSMFDAGGATSAQGLGGPVNGVFDFFEVSPAS